MPLSFCTRLALLVSSSCSAIESRSCHSPRQPQANRLYSRVHCAQRQRLSAPHAPGVRILEPAGGREPFCLPAASFPRKTRPCFRVGCHPLMLLADGWLLLRFCRLTFPSKHRHPSVAQRSPDKRYAPWRSSAHAGGLGCCVAVHRGKPGAESRLAAGHLGENLANCVSRRQSLPGHGQRGFTKAQHLQPDWLQRVRRIRTADTRARWRTAGALVICPHSSADWARLSGVLARPV